jgi:putative Mg2+ transporter-C (MgtC) family protein
MEPGRRRILSVVIDPSHLHFSTLQQMLLSQSSTTRLLMACAMGGLIGIEREWRHKDSGLRTNMLISMGSALFTIMSVVIAGDQPNNRGQIAANIVQGVGFLGAGLILHTKSKTIGLTSAATVFVVAAIGMTCGAGLYIEAAIATALVLLALQVVGAFEGRLGWKRYAMIYEVRANVGATLDKDAVGADKAESTAQDVNDALQRMQKAILAVLDSVHQRLSVLERDNIGGLERVSFTVTTTKSMHQRLLQQLRASDATDEVVAFFDTEED